MCSVLLRRLSAFAAILLLLSPALAAKFKPADYPMRVHIVARNGIRHYYHPGYWGGGASLDQVDGLGAANLFENGQPKGFDFNYNCGQPLTPQNGYETFPARWKKQDRVLEIMMPKMGAKPDDMNSCELKVAMKPDTVYIRRNGAVAEEPAARFKQWMDRHQYDPERGMNEPVNPRAAGQKESGDDQQQ
jgi:hypothetical protein